MSDITANQIVFLILIFVLVGALFALNIVTKVSLYSTWLGRMRNSSGNYDVGKIIGILIAAVAVYFLVYYLLKGRTTTRPSQTREQFRQ